MNVSVESQSQELIQAIWQPALDRKKRLWNGDPVEYLCLDAYCKYYQHQWHLVVGNAGGRYVALQSPDSLNQLVSSLHTAGGKVSRQELLDTHQQHIGTCSGVNTSAESVENSINLAARLLLMLKIGVVKHQAIPRRCLDWREGSLQSFVHGYFSTPPVLHHGHIRLPKSFDAWGIAKIAGVQIDFTDNLADHLLLVEDDSKLLIFHHAAFLECQHQQDLYPGGLVDETFRTMALLFPQSEYSGWRNKSRRGGDNKSESRDSWLFWRRPVISKKGKWMAALAEAKRDHGMTLDARLTRCGNLQAEDRQLERFVFWRDRLVVLKQAYDDATPRTLGQWWHDRRNGVQWYTFWVAVVVLVITTLLGVVQCVEGALQVYKAYEDD